MAMKWIEKITLRKEDLRGERIPWITKEKVAVAERKVSPVREISRLPEVRLVELPGPVICEDNSEPMPSEPERSPYIDLRELSRRILEDDIVIEHPSRVAHTVEPVRTGRGADDVCYVPATAVNAPRGVTSNRITSIEKDSFIESAIPVRYIDVEPRPQDDSFNSGMTLRGDTASAVPEVEDYVKAAEESTRHSIADTFEDAYRRRIRERGGDDEEFEDDKPLDDGEITSKTDDDDDDFDEPDDDEITSHADEDDEELEAAPSDDEEITAKNDDDDDDFDEPDDDEITSKDDDDAAAREK
ncbi:MAG TPA: hypothetical protein PKK43_13870, partial [Spirochaetota bacterium]|nr:hypothetical protein [Spirochaetota bacterium]